MIQLIAEEYLSIHIKICQELEKNDERIYYLKKKEFSHYPNQISHYYKIEHEYNHFVDYQLKEEEKSRICKLNEIVSFFNKNKSELLFFNHNLSWLNNEQKIQYYEDVLKTESSQQIFYCLLNIFVNEIYDDMNKENAQFFINTANYFLCWIKTQSNCEKIIQQYWQQILSKSPYYYPEYIKIHLREQMLSILSEIDNVDIETVLPIIYINGTKEKLLSYLEEDFTFQNSFNKFANLSYYIPYLVNRSDGLEILSTFLKNKDINKNEDEAIIIRDLLIKYFPNDLHHFDMLEILQNYHDEVFYSIDNKVIVIQYYIDKFQKKFKLKGLIEMGYYHIMVAFQIALVKQKTLKIYDVNIVQDQENYQKIILHMDKNVLLIEQDFIYMLKDYYSIFINENIESINKFTKYNSNQIPDILIQNGLIDWLSSYILSYQFNQNLKTKNIISNVNKI